MKFRRDIVLGLLVVWAWVSPLNAMEGTAANSQSLLGLDRLAETEQAMLEQRGVVMHDDRLNGYLQAVAARLWQQVDTDLSAPTIQVVMDTRMEAFAYPNGYCYLTTGILARIANEDQLAMILAHEMVHYLRRHSARFYHHFLKPMDDSDPQSDDRVRAVDGQAVQQQIDAAEKQADEEGLSILKRAGYCQAEVLPLLDNLMDGLKHRRRPGAVAQMRKRVRDVKAMLGRTAEASLRTPAEAGDRKGFSGSVAPALLGNGQAALQRGEWVQAEESVSRYLTIRAEDARAYYLKGEILRRQNHDDGNHRAVDYYEQAIEIDPGFATAQRALGELHFKAGRYQAAKSYFEAFLSLNPRDDAREYIKGYLRLCQD